MDSGSTLGCGSQQEKKIGTIAISLNNIMKKFVVSCISFNKFQG